MKNLIPVYLLLFLMLLSVGLLSAQNRGKVISGDQIIILNPSTGIFKIQNVNDPGGEVGDSVEVSLDRNEVAFASEGIAVNQFATSVRTRSGIGEILSMSGVRGQSGQIMYKTGDRFTLINYQNQRPSSDLGVGSCVSFKIKSGRAVRLEAGRCDF